MVFFVAVVAVVAVVAAVFVCSFLFLGQSTTKRMACACFGGWCTGLAGGRWREVEGGGRRRKEVEGGGGQVTAVENRPLRSEIQPGSLCFRLVGSALRCK